MLDKIKGWMNRGKEGAVALNATPVHEPKIGILPAPDLPQLPTDTDKWRASPEFIKLAAYLAWWEENLKKVILALETNPGVRETAIVKYNLLNSLRGQLEDPVKFKEQILDRFKIKAKE